MGPETADGPESGDMGSYHAFRPDPTGPATKAIAGGMSGMLRQRTDASRQEWRTPPLWGVRDSGPYLHDGRADTLERAIALHGGEGRPTASRYSALPPEGREAVIAFLKSLVAPTGGEDRSRRSGP